MLNARFWRRCIRYQTIIIYCMFLIDGVYNDLILDTSCDFIPNDGSLKTPKYYFLSALDLLLTTLILWYLNHRPGTVGLVKLGFWCLLGISLIPARLLHVVEGFYSPDCSDENCDSCLASNKNVCIKCINISMCETKPYFVSNTKIEEERACREKCPGGYYLMEMDVDEKFCCEKCSDMCLGSCTGNGTFAGTNGCGRCKFGVFNQIAEKYDCLNPNYDKHICSENNLSNHYLVERSESFAVKYECLPCDKNCSSCFSDDCLCPNRTILSTDHPIRCVQAINGSNTRIGPIYDLKKAIIETSIPTASPEESNLGFIVYVIGAAIIILGIIFTLVYFYNTKQRRTERNNFTAINFHRQSSKDIECNAQESSFFLDLPLQFSTRRSTSKTYMDSYGDSYEPPKRTPKSSVSTRSRNNYDDRLNTIKKNELTIFYTNKLGEGHFGVVHKGRWLDQDVAIKSLKNFDYQIAQDALTESRFMAKLTHPYLQNLLGICICDAIMIVSKLREGSLIEYLKNNYELLGIVNLLKYCVQISSAIEYLHSHDIIHGDLAARNVLVVNRDQVEVADFGLAKELHGMKGFINRKDAPLRWMSLETLKSGAFDKLNDVWSFGITAWEIFNYGQKTPYWDDGLLLRDKKAIVSFLENDRLCQPDEGGSDVHKIILLCWLPMKARPEMDVIKREFDKLLALKSSPNNPEHYKALSSTHYFQD